MLLNRNITLILVFIILAAAVLTLVAYPYGIIHVGVFGTVEMFLIFLLILLFLILLAVIVETWKKLQDQSSAMSRFKDIIQGSRSMGFVWRIKPGQWPVEFVTENVEQLTGYTADDFMSGRVSWPGITHPEDVPRLEKEVSEYLDRGVNSWSQEYRLITKSGAIKWFCDDNRVITDKRGNVSKIQAIIHDITERKEAEKQKDQLLHDLREHHKKLTCLYEISNLIEKPGITLGHILKNTPSLIREAMESPDVAGAKIVYEDKEHATNNFQPTQWRLSADIKSAGEKRGAVTVCYLEDRSFLKEEALLINEVAQRLGGVIERTAAENNLRASEQSYRTLFDGTVCSIIAADSETKKFVYVNQSVCRMLGYSPEELLRLGVEDIHPQDSLDKAISGFETQTRGERVQVTIPCIRKDGAVFYADVSAGAMVLNGRKCTVGFFTAATERIEAERMAAVLAEAIENAHHGCLMMTEDYKLLSGNHYALAKLGLDLDELQRLDWFSLCADREQTGDAMKTIKITRRWAGEVTIVQKDGGQFPALVSITAIEAEGRKAGPESYIILFQDISTHKELQGKLLTSEKLAVMGRLVADVAHEINNPLAIIIGGTQLMLSRLDEKQAALKDQLETVLRNARRCKIILSGLLGYGRTLGRQEETINLPSLIREAIDDVNYQYDMSGMEMELKHEGAADTEIIGNRSALLSVFINLIRNARQAMGEKGRLAIISKEQKGNLIRVDIHDTGVGMSKKQIAKLFMPFVSGWKDEEGSGLGLATSLGIVETHGGRLTAESEGEGKGTTFTILLPRKIKVNNKQQNYAKKNTGH